MAIARVTASSLTQGLPKRRTMLAGNSVILPGSYDAIGTATGTGSNNSVTFSSIPSTYKHLQLRATVRCTGGAGTSLLWWRANGLTSTSNYTSHGLGGDGSSAYAYNLGSSYGMGLIGSTAHSGSTANAYATIVLDILDYANTNKYKTTRALRGEDYNGSGDMRLSSGLFISTSAISSFSVGFFDNAGSYFTSLSTIDLYGIK
jgi:hypothetical protein